MSEHAYTVQAVEFASTQAALHAVRGAVFIDEQGVPAEIERDALDPACIHVLARDSAGAPIGAGRLTPDRRIGRMAVLRDWRGRGVGEALLRALVEQAQARGWPQVSLHAQASAIAFYRRHGFVPQGARFMEAGIEHQTMHRVLAGPTPVETREQALAATLAVIGHARRQLRIYSRELDPGLLDSADVIAAMRRFATGGGEVRIVLQDTDAPRRALAPLIGLAQRLPSAFALRAVDDPVDQAYPAAYIVNDADGWYYRPLGHSVEGETRLGDAPRARQLRQSFDPVWERSRLATEFRTLGI